MHVGRKDLSKVRFMAQSDAASSGALPDASLRVRIDKFGLSANNSYVTLLLSLWLSVKGSHSTLLNPPCSYIRRDGRGKVSVL